MGRIYQPINAIIKWTEFTKQLGRIHRTEFTIQYRQRGYNIGTPSPTTTQKARYYLGKAESPTVQDHDVTHLCAFSVFTCRGHTTKIDSYDYVIAKCSHVKELRCHNDCAFCVRPVYYYKKRSLCFKVRIKGRDRVMVKLGVGCVY